MAMVSDTGNLFPPCTSESCDIDEDEKRRVAAKFHSNPCEMAERCVSSCAAYGKVCPCAARVAASAACDAMKQLGENSQVFTKERPDFTHLDADDIKIGKKVGEGGFSNVNKCIVQAGDEAGQEFAVKYLKRRAMADKHTFKHGAADLAIEAYFLQTLDHPNIVKLHGVSAGSVETCVASGRECGFFIVIDLLDDTLEARLEKWREEQEKNPPNLLTRRTADYKAKKHQELMERCRIALSVAEAVDYLHSLNIVFRDLKPDNIGFQTQPDGSKETVKIFDFGLAKELKPGMETQNGRYRLTGNTGSRRYMAPEVAKDCPYDKSVDVYSFGILLWELCSGEKPFFGYSSGKHMQQIVLGGERPKMDISHTANWPMSLQWLMKRCWSPFISERPTFAVIKKVLTDILEGIDRVPSEKQEEEESQEVELLEEPSGGFGALFRVPQNKRGKAAGTPPPPEEGFQAIKRPSASGGRRNRTWGFLRR